MGDKRYKNPPVIEAVIEIRFSPKATLKSERIADYIDRKIAGFQTIESLRTIESKIDAKKGLQSTTTDELGFKLSGHSDSVVLQLRKNGFVFSKLAPYQKWENFRDVAFEYWVDFSRFVMARSYDRVGLRYINAISIGRSRFDLEDYVTAHPVWDPRIGDDLNQCSMSVGFPFPKQRANAKLLMEPRGDKIILDIDVYRSDQLPRTPAPAKRVFDQLKLIERKIFESSITDKARELFR